MRKFQQLKNNLRNMPEAVTDFLSDLNGLNELDLYNEADDTDEDWGDEEDDDWDEEDDEDY